ncbi:arcadin 1 [Candidatus Bathyarchaeota archaeon]|nr:arcadin 1 [Candidatus Bathyarchaeota archaeon]
MIDNIKFTMKVFAIRPTFDSKGNEYVSVEFGYRPPKIPTMVPATVPREISEAIRTGREMVKVIVPPELQSHLRRYANRLILFLSTSEWEQLQHKYTVGDEFEVEVRSDGNISINRILNP